MGQKIDSRSGEKVTWIGAIANIFLAIIKIVVGFIGKSEALIADGVHSLSDLLTDAVVLVSLKVARKPVDEKRPYGYGRVETVGTGIMGVVLIFVGIGIFWDSVITIQEGINYIPSGISLVVAFSSIIVKEGLYHYTVYVGKRLNSTSLIANAWHHRTDALSSIATFIGIGAAMMGWPIFDPVAALIVTVLIIKVGWEIARDSFRDIIDTAVKKEIREKIIKAAMETPGALNYHDLKTRKMGRDILVDIHIEVNPWMNVSEAHTIADNVKDSIIEKVDHIADVLVHIDPEGEYDGIVYSTPKDEIMSQVANAASSVEGVIGHRNILLHYVGSDIIVTLTIELSPELTIKESHKKATEVKDRILEIEMVKDTTISVDLHTSKEREV